LDGWSIGRVAVSAFVPVVTDAIAGIYFGEGVLLHFGLSPGSFCFAGSINNPDAGRQVCGFGLACHGVNTGVLFFSALPLVGSCAILRILAAGCNVFVLGCGLSLPSGMWVTL
jgi:hypothetical protein